ncbi:MAG: hypothetical protein IJ484_01520 [Oscillospiraceae bacterium]|nr:hypothetical protein [Oscillospiraceae bacterium]
MGTVLMAPSGGKVTTEGLTAANIVSGKTVTVKQGAKVVAKVEGTGGGVKEAQAIGLCVCRHSSMAHNKTDLFDPVYNLGWSSSLTSTFTCTKAGKYKLLFEYISCTSGSTACKFTVTLNGTAISAGTLCDVELAVGDKLVVTSSGPSDSSSAGGLITFIAEK